MRTTVGPATALFNDSRSVALIPAAGGESSGGPSRATPGNFETTLSLEAVLSGTPELPPISKMPIPPGSRRTPEGRSPHCSDRPDGQAGRSRTGQLDHPSPDVPALYVDAHLCPYLDTRREVFGHRVDELLAQSRQIGDYESGELTRLTPQSARFRSSTRGCAPR